MPLGRAAWAGLATAATRSSLIHDGNKQTHTTSSSSNHRHQSRDPRVKLASFPTSTSRASASPSLSGSVAAAEGHACDLNLCWPVPIPQGRSAPKRHAPREEGYGGAAREVLLRQPLRPGPDALSLRLGRATTSKLKRNINKKAHVLRPYLSFRSLFLSLFSRTPSLPLLVFSPSETCAYLVLPHPARLDLEVREVRQHLACDK